jgi:small subunit ribosomal protein S28e
MGSKKKSKKKAVKKKPSRAPKRERNPAAIAVSEHAVPGRVMEIVGKMGTREGGKQVRVKVMDGRDANKIIRRNVLGPIKVGDVLMLKETEIEASPLKGRKG